MKAQPVMRVKRRAVRSYSFPSVWSSKRKTTAIISVAVLLAVVIASAWALLARTGSYSFANDSTVPSDADYRILDQGYAAYMYQADESVTKTQSWDRMIIRTATVDMTVKDVAAAVERIKTVTAQQGGYVFSSESHVQGDYTYATVTVYVPAKDFEQIMPLLKGLDGQVDKVNSENITSSDVTEEYTDLQSQMRNLKATEARLLDLQSRATELEDVLAVDRELRTVQGEIETTQGRINFLDKRTSMSTVTMQLSPIAAPPLKPQTLWQPLEAAANAWDASLEMLGSLSTGIISAAVFMWWLVPVVIFGVWLTMRMRRKAAVASVEA